MEGLSQKMVVPHVTILDLVKIVGVRRTNAFVIRSVLADADEISLKRAREIVGVAEAGDPGDEWLTDHG